MGNESKGNATQRTHTHTQDSQAATKKAGTSREGKRVVRSLQKNGRPENQEPGMEDGRAEALAREVKAPWETDSGNLRK